MEIDDKEENLKLGILNGGTYHKKIKLRNVIESAGVYVCGGGGLRANQRKLSEDVLCKLKFEY